MASPRPISRMDRLAHARRLRPCLPALCLLAFAFAWPAGASHQLERVLQLDPGWNAVYFELEPDETDPAVLFGGLPVDVAAVHTRAASTAQFINDPSVNMHEGAAWSVWYAPSRPDAFLSTLFAIHGTAAVLVHATESCTFRYTGQPVLTPAAWVANAFTFTGANLVPGLEPTYGQYFSASKAHDHNRIYRLVGGTWRQVLDPDATPMRSGEAFWIHTEGASRYTGPLEVVTRSRDGLYLVGGQDSLRMYNRTDHPIGATLDHLETEGEPVPLAIRVRVVGNPAHPFERKDVPQPDGAWSETLPPLEGGQGRELPFVARMGDMTAAEQTSILRITTDLGTCAWVPVTAVRSDLRAERADP